MEGQARGQTSDSDILAQAPGHSSDTVADGRFLIHDIHGAIIIYILIFLLMSVLSHNCCPFVLYYTQFCSGTFLRFSSNSRQPLPNDGMVWWDINKTKHFHQAGSVSVGMLMVGGWCVCGVRGGSTALHFSFISDILGIVVQMLNVFCFTNSGCISRRFICNISDTCPCQMWPVVKVFELEQP